MSTGSAQSAAVATGAGGVSAGAGARARLVVRPHCHDHAGRSARVCCRRHEVLECKHGTERRQGLSSPGGRLEKRRAGLYERLRNRLHHDPLRRLRIIGEVDLELPILERDDARCAAGEGGGGEGRGHGLQRVAAADEALPAVGASVPLGAAASATGGERRGGEVPAICCTRRRRKRRCSNCCSSCRIGPALRFLRVRRETDLLLICCRRWR